MAEVKRLKYRNYNFLVWLDDDDSRCTIKAANDMMLHVIADKDIHSNKPIWIIQSGDKLFRKYERILFADDHDFQSVFNLACDVLYNRIHFENKKDFDSICKDMTDFVNIWMDDYYE